MDMNEPENTSKVTKKKGRWLFIIAGVILFEFGINLPKGIILSDTASIVFDTIAAIGVVLFCMGLARLGIGTNLFNRKKK